MCVARMYIKLPETVPHGVHGPVDYLVHDRWLQGLQEQISQHYRLAFVYQPDLDQPLQFRGGELQRGV